MNEIIRKYAYIFISIIIAIIIILSPKPTWIKVISVIVQIPINKILDRYFFDKFSKNKNILKLKNMKYLGLNPKIEMIMDIYVFLFIYTLISIYILGYNITFIESRLIKVVLIIPVLFIIIDGIYGRHVDEKNLDDGTVIYNISYSSRENNDVFGVRVGKFEDGILIGNYIFYNKEIYFTTYSQDFEFIFILTNDRKIIIRDKKAVDFFKEEYK